MLDNNDIVYASKIKATYDLKTILQTESQKKEIKNHLPDLEFWTAFYRKDFLLKNSIQFYEYKKQDIETAFRYLCNLYASKYVILSDFYFMIQRDNLRSNTHTWNKQAFCSVKARVCLDLLSRTCCEPDKYVLYEMAFNCVYDWFNQILQFGQSEDTIDSSGNFRTVYRLLMKYGKTYFIKNLTNLKKMYKMKVGILFLFAKKVKTVSKVKNEIKHKNVSVEKTDIKNEWLELSKKFLLEESILDKEHL